MISITGFSSAVMFINVCCTKISYSQSTSYISLFLLYNINPSLFILYFNFVFAWTVPVYFQAWFSSMPTICVTQEFDWFQVHRPLPRNPSTQVGIPLRHCGLLWYSLTHCGFVLQQIYHLVYGVGAGYYAGYYAGLLVLIRQSPVLYCTGVISIVVK